MAMTETQTGLVLTGHFVASEFRRPSDDGLGAVTVAVTAPNGRPSWETALFFAEDRSGEGNPLVRQLAEMSDGELLSLAVDIRTGKTGKLWLQATALVAY